MLRAVLAVYLLGVAVLTALVARRKGRSAPVWFVGGLAGGIPLLLLALIAPASGEHWRSRALVAIALFAALALSFILLIVGISEAHFTY